jgi:hypothetical protein
LGADQRGNCGSDDKLATALVPKLRLGTRLRAKLCFGEVGLEIVDPVPSRVLSTENAHAASGKGEHRNDEDREQLHGARGAEV